MIIITDTFIPYEFETRKQYADYIEERTLKIKHSLRFVEIDDEHLIVRCPVVGDYLEIVGTENEINWLHSELTKRELYRIK